MTPHPRSNLPEPLSGVPEEPLVELGHGFPWLTRSEINRLVRQKVVDSARRAGVTRTLRWVRLGQDLDLLDAPGVLPPRLDDQQAALRLALCDDIGQAARISGMTPAAISLLLIHVKKRSRRSA